MIVQTVTEQMFIEEFRTMDRMENFSINGLRALYSFFDELSDDTGQPFELDVIAICCDFSELTYKEIASNYDIVSYDELAELDDSHDDESDDFNEEQQELIVDRLNEETIVVYHDDEKVLYQQF